MSLCELLFPCFAAQGVLYFQRRLFEQWSGRDYKSYIISFSLRDVMCAISI